MRLSKRTATIGLFVSAMLIVIAVAIYLWSNRTTTVTFSSVVNSYEAVLKKQYLELSANNPELPRYYSPCGDSELSVRIGETMLTPHIAADSFAAYRTDGELILLGTGCNNQNSPIKPNNVYLLSYKISDGTLVQQQKLSDAKTPFKSYVEGGKLEVAIAINGEIDLLQVNADLSTSKIKALSTEDYRSIPEKVYLNDLVTRSVRAENEVVLNPVIGEISLNYSDLTEIK